MLAMRPDDLRGRAIFLDSFESFLTDCMTLYSRFFPTKQPDHKYREAARFFAPGWRRDAALLNARRLFSALISYDDQSGSHREPRKNQHNRKQQTCALKQSWG